jgi:RNA polymerase sigma-70 factor (ECF subfamily)
MSPTHQPILATVVDDDGFERFYRANYRQAVALGSVLSGRRAVGEELAQEAFSAAYARWGEVAGYDEPGAWLRRVIANKAASHVRRLVRYREKIRLIREPTTTDPEADEVWDEVRRLPVRQAQAIALHYLEDLPVSDIAAILECSESAVKTHLTRARARLAERLGTENDG